MKAIRLPRRRNPATPDRTVAARAQRELASRQSEGLHIALLWHPIGDAVAVSVADAHTGHGFTFPVDGRRALDAFYHPFAYAP